ncbi:DNA-binding protein [Modestobacter lapidis]|nr:DNA-binding protein [Modestobacter lapidis]
MGRPASRALAAAGYRAPADLTAVSERELLALHGVGPRAVERLRRTMAEQGLAFRR